VQFTDLVCMLATSSIHYTVHKNKLCSYFKPDIVINIQEQTGNLKYKILHVYSIKFWHPFCI